MALPPTTDVFISSAGESVRDIQTYIRQWYSSDVKGEDAAHSIFSPELNRASTHDAPFLSCFTPCPERASKHSSLVTASDIFFVSLRDDGVDVYYAGLSGFGVFLVPFGYKSRSVTGFLLSIGSSTHTHSFQCEPFQSFSAFDVTDSFWELRCVDFARCGYDNLLLVRSTNGETVPCSGAVVIYRDGQLILFPREFRTHPFLVTRVLTRMSSECRVLEHSGAIKATDFLCCVDPDDQVTVFSLLLDRVVAITLFDSDRSEESFYATSASVWFTELGEAVLTVVGFDDEAPCGRILVYESFRVTDSVARLSLERTIVLTGMPRSIVFNDHRCVCIGEFGLSIYNLSKNTRQYIAIDNSMRPHLPFLAFVNPTNYATFFDVTTVHTEMNVFCTSNHPSPGHCGSSLAFRAQRYVPDGDPEYLFEKLKGNALFFDAADLDYHVFPVPQCDCRRNVFVVVVISKTKAGDVRQGVFFYQLTSA